MKKTTCINEKIKRRNMQIQKCTNMHLKICLNLYLFAHICIICSNKLCVFANCVKNLLLFCTGYAFETKPS